MPDPARRRPRVRPGSSFRIYVAKRVDLRILLDFEVTGYYLALEKKGAHTPVRVRVPADDLLSQPIAIFLPSGPRSNRVELLRSQT